MREESLKYLLGILLLTQSFHVFAQENKMDKKIKELFFDLDLNQKPEEIVKASDFEFDYYTYKILTEIHTYTAEFKEYPKVDSEIKKGTFTIEYDTSREGIIKSTLVINFEHQADRINAYEKLKAEFIDQKGKETIEKKPEYGLDIKFIEYYQYKNKKIPRLTISCVKFQPLGPALIIEYVNNRN